MVAVTGAVSAPAASVIEEAEPAAAAEGTRGSAAMSSTEPSLLPACTERVESPSVMAPAGISAPFCCSASRTDRVLKPRAVSSVTLGMMVTRWPTSPESAASRTPGRSRRSPSTLRVSSSARVLLSVPPAATAREITGKSSILPLITCGSRSSGRVERMRLIAWLMRDSALTRSVP